VIELARLALAKMLFSKELPLRLKMAALRRVLQSTMKNHLEVEEKISQL